MAIRDIFKISRKTFFNPMGWLDFNFLSAQTNNIFIILRILFVPPKPEREETFEQAMKRMHISEKDIASMGSSYRMYALFFVLIAFITFCYSFYILFLYHAFFACILGLAITALFLAKAFQFDFWAFQIKRRKLGSTFNEWFEAVFGKQGGSK